MRICTPSPEQFAFAAQGGVPSPTGPSTTEMVGGVEAGRIRPEWTVVAIDESGAVVGRALWCGRDSAVPTALEVWDVDVRVSDRAAVATALLAAGHEVLAGQGVDRPATPHSAAAERLARQPGLGGRGRRDDPRGCRGGPDARQ